MHAERATKEISERQQPDSSPTAARAVMVVEAIHTGRATKELRGGQTAVRAESVVEAMHAGRATSIRSAPRADRSSSRDCSRDVFFELREPDLRHRRSQLGIAVDLICLSFRS